MFVLFAVICVFGATWLMPAAVRTPEGVKTVRVQFNSDEEWIER